MRMLHTRAPGQRDRVLALTVEEYPHRLLKLPQIPGESSGEVNEIGYQQQGRRAGNLTRLMSMTR